MVSCHSSVFGADGIDWYAFLERPRLPAPEEKLLGQFCGSSIVVTGAGGSIGSALSHRLAALKPRSLVLIDSSEQALHRLQTEFAATSMHVQMVLGNVLDVALVDEVLDTHRPQFFFHAAAYKHVPLLEEHPLAAIKNNALGTLAVTESAKKLGVGRVVFLSTDKAVAPASILGASKQIAEQIVMASGGTALRLANVLGTEGSVSETFLRQIAAGGPVTIADPEAERYFVTLEEAVDLLLAAATQTAGLVVPNLKQQYRIARLAEFLVAVCAPEKEPAVVLTGLRAGDKMREALWSDEEVPMQSDAAASIEIKQQARDQAQLRTRLTGLEQAVGERNLPLAIDLVLQLAPAYTPSAMVEALLARAHGEVMPG